MAVLDGVRIGPLDPDRAEGMGMVGGQTTARQLIRHHIAMHPPELIRALSRQRQDARSEAVDREEAEKYIRAAYDEAGEALPEDSKLAGFAVRGDDESPELQVVTFTYSTPGGRTGKGFVPYRELSRSVEAGDERVRIETLKAAGLPWQPEGLAQSETKADQAQLDQNDALMREVRELRARLETVEGQQPTDAASAGGGSGVASSPQTPEGGSAASGGSQGDGGAAIEDEFSDLDGAELTDAVEGVGIDWRTGGSGIGGMLTRTEAQTLLRQHRDAGDAGDEDDEDDDDGEEPEPSAERPAEPWDGYEGANAQDVRRRLRESKDADLAQRVLAYETRSDGGANRSTIVAAANELLDRPPAG